jgi:hypothetical protein
MNPPITNAVIKNGVKCSVSGNTIKSGSTTYRCAKNPYVLPKQLTWTNSKCLSGVRLIKRAKADYDTWKVFGTSDDIEKLLSELSISIRELEITAEKKLCKKGG